VKDDERDNNIHGDKYGRNGRKAWSIWMHLITKNNASMNSHKYHLRDYFFIVKTYTYVCLLKRKYALFGTCAIHSHLDFNIEIQMAKLSSKLTAFGHLVGDGSLGMHSDLPHNKQ